jgi:signal transduction histidine kinase
MGPVSFLLVDDLEENLLSLEALLRRDGLSLLKARNGDEALELLLQNDVALALVDVQMPGLNGFELAELMRGNERTRRIPIIFVTAGTTDSRRRFQGYEAGAVDFIQKPIETDVLRSKADVFFELYRQRQQIAEQRDVLELQAQALKQADRRKDEFLATLAHELRNPLAPLRQGLDVLRKNPDHPDGVQIRDRMDRQLGNLVHLIDDLLDVSRVSQGKIDLRKEKVNLRDVVNQAVEASRPHFEGANHRLSVELPQQDVWLEADPTRLSQILANLLNNAAKYTPNGGSIAVTGSLRGPTLELVVTDNGVGIPQEMQSDIFELFTQVGSHSERSQGGLGIGLALVRQLVELHGGTVRAASAGIGMGSSFHIELPISKSVAATDTTQERKNAAGKSNGRLKVLVVDDNIDVADVTGWMLEEIGHEYLTINDGRDALREAMSFQPDVILLDIGLPELDGHEVCRILRANQRFKDTVIIAQTGWGQEKDKQKSIESGFNRHLTKPVSLDVLAETINEAYEIQSRSIVL